MGGWPMDQGPVCLFLEFVSVVNKVYARFDPSLPSSMFSDRCLEAARRESRRLKSEREKHNHGPGKLEAHAFVWESLAESSSSDEETSEKEH